MNEWITTWEAARILAVGPKTVTRWARDGKLPHQRTLGGHRRYPRAGIEEIAAAMTQAATWHPDGPR